MPETRSRKHVVRCREELKKELTADKVGNRKLMFGEISSYSTFRKWTHVGNRHADHRRAIVQKRLNTARIHVELAIHRV